MGETIRLLMVATIALLGLCLGSWQDRPLSGQGTGGFRIPASLSGAVDQLNAVTGRSGQPSAGSQSSAGSQPASAAPSMGLPSFTGQDDVARSRAGGPSTEPVNPRDRNWMADVGTSRPTTDPVSSGTDTASSYLNQLRSGTIATVAATQDPNSREAQFNQERQGTPSPAGNAATRSGTPGFGNLPDGVRLPARSTTAVDATGTFGSEFARDTTSGNPQRPVYGPPTAAEANFDWSVYNANNPNSGTNAAVTAGQSMPGQNTTAARGTGLGYTLPGASNSSAMGSDGLGSGYSTAQQQLGTSRTGLGFPAGTANLTGQPSATQSPTAQWSAQQVAALAAKFNIASNDPRLQNQVFVNDLWFRFRDWQDRQEANDRAGASANSSSAGSQFGYSNPNGQLSDGGRSLTSGRGNEALQPSAAGGGQTPMDYARLASNDPLNQPFSPSDLQLGAAPTSEQRGAQRGVPRKPLFDSFGNRVDADGNILDENGRPVDEATAYELTYGKKLREDMEKLRREQAELLREKTTAPAQGPLAQLASANVSQADPRLGGRSPSASSRPGETVPGSQAGVAEAGLDTTYDRPQIDEAGVAGGASQALGRSNPYVNVFLLCSLVSNAFLFVWLHRLWHHHRDLIASSRMAASGVSSSD